MYIFVSAHMCVPCSYVRHDDFNQLAYTCMHVTSVTSAQLRSNNACSEMYSILTVMNLFVDI